MYASCSSRTTGPVVLCLFKKEGAMLRSSDMRSLDAADIEKPLFTGKGTYILRRMCQDDPCAREHRYHLRMPFGA